MPTGFPKALFPQMYKKGKDKPADGGAVGGGSAPTPSVKQPIKDMLAPGSEEQFVASLPDSTATPATPPGPTPEKKTRKPRTITPEGEDDPLMSDPRYKSAVTNMSGLGGARLVKVAFNVTGKGLDGDEEVEVDDLFYVIGKRSKLDPGASWFVLGLYAIFLLARLVVVRTDAGEQLKKLFDSPKQSEQAKEVENATREN